MNATLRDAHEGDFPHIERLNRESEHFLSPMDAARLSLLHELADYHRVVDCDGVRAFLLAFREGSEYDSSNYRWFDARYDRFLYIDRVVVDASWRGRGFAGDLYRDLFGYARAFGVARIVCEYDIEPPNPSSRAFHQRFGFQEVGRRSYGAGKRVSLQLVDAHQHA